MNNDFLNRTVSAIGEEFLAEIQSYKYCVVGCGGTGALFAEMLVRTGAQKVVLIDGDKIEESNLNRVISFVSEDVGKPKVEALQLRLEKINPDIEVTSINCHFRGPDPNDTDGQKARDEICNADIIIIAVDKNRDRIGCEDFCYQEDANKKIISIGVYVDEDGSSGYECGWNRKTPCAKEEAEGYGIGSYASIVIEATAVAFSMLLCKLKNPSSDFEYFFKSYKNFVPEEHCKN